MPGAGYSHSITALSWAGDTKGKFYGSRQGQGEITHQLLSWVKQTQLGEKYFNLLPIK